MGDAPKDKFNISNDQYYEVAKDGGRHRVRQTFGQLVVQHAYPAQKLQLPFVRIPHRLFVISYLLCHFLKKNNFSTRPVCRNRKLVHSIDPPSNFHPTSSFVSPKYGQRKRRKTRLVEKLAKVETLARVFTELAISVSKTQAILFFGSFLKSTHRLFRISVWAVYWLIIIERKTRRMSIYPRYALRQFSSLKF